MNIDLDKKLVAKYPKLFVYRNTDNQMTGMYRGFECGDGWFWLIDKLCETIQSHIDLQPEKVPQVSVNLVKQKFGELRFYYDGGDNYIRGMVQLASQMSTGICEKCGAIENTGQTTGWIQTLCENCANADPEAKATWKKG
jgi:hypothetical protein